MTVSHGDALTESMSALSHFADSSRTSHEVPRSANRGPEQDSSTWTEWGTREQRRRHFEAERPGGFQVDDQLVLGRRLHRQVGRPLALQDTIDVVGRLLYCATSSAPWKIENVVSKPRRLLGQSAIAMKIMAPKLKAIQRQNERS